MGSAERKVANGRTDERVEGIDLLRFLLAAAVLIFHYAYARDGYDANAETGPRALLFGRYAVDAFFIISGMVIARSAHDRSITDFAVNRIVRLLPAIWICATLTLVITQIVAPGAPNPDVWQWLLSVLLLPLALSEDYGADWSYWSLTYELRFYIMAAVFFLFFRSSWAMLTGIAVWLAASLAAMITDFPPLKEVFSSKAAPAFALGVLIYLYGVAASLRRYILVLGAIATGILGFTLWKVSLEPFEPHPITLIEAGVSAIAVVAIVLAFTAVRSLGKFGRIAAWCGAASYPLYLLHQLIGYAMIGKLTAAGMDTAISIAITAFVIIVAAFVIALGPERWIARRLKAGLKWAIGAAKQLFARRVPPVGRVGRYRDFRTPLPRPIFLANSERRSV
jgi:peptidoglycan/LPS O-acetylase OafA/YrhL